MCALRAGTTLLYLWLFQLRFSDASLYPECPYFSDYLRFVVARSIIFHRMFVQANRLLSAAISSLKRYPPSNLVFSQILNNAVSADAIVKGKYSENKEGFLMLSKGEADLSSSLPAASPAAALQGSPVVAGRKGLAKTF